MGLGLANAASGGSRAAATPDATGDLEIVAQLLTMEQMATSLYREGLTQFTSDETTSGDRFLPTQPTLARIWRHERSHLELLSKAIAELGIPTPLGQPPDVMFVDFSTFLLRAAELKQQHVAAYVAAVTVLKEVKLRSLVARILAVEARHAAYLNERIGTAPFSAEREGQVAATNPLLDLPQMAGS